MVLFQKVVLFLVPLMAQAFTLSSISSKRTRGVVTTKLHVQPQRKPPRFTQQVHKKKKSPPLAPQTTKKLKKRQVWESDKSIDELESRMMKRWGALDDNKASSSSKESSSSSSSGMRRPVLDPWEADEKKTAAAFSRQRQEYYDEDDEGFEYIEIDEDDDSIELNEVYEERMTQRRNSKNGRMKIDHLIAPRPAGGRGTGQKLADEPSGSYFFNPNSVTKTVSPPKDSRNDKDKTRTLEDFTKTTAQKRDKPSAAMPLLDEDGEPILLSIDEALYRFQSEFGNEDDVIEIMETDEAPIVARSESQSWEDLGITSPILLENLQAMNCPTPLAVQEKVCPPVITGNDVLVGTYTGSGKTLAFLTPLLERLLWNADPSKDIGLAVLVVAPGRELASQIVSVARELLEDTGLTVQLAIGGTTFSRNLEQIRKRRSNILVGTPGRIAELVVGKPGEKSGRLKIGSLQALVLDEFDALLEYKPHRDPTRAIMQTLKRRHGEALQSILCSATASDIMDSAKVVDFFRPGFATAMADKDDVLVTSAKGPRVSRTVLHGVVHVPHRRMALDTVRRILHTEPFPQQILIFAENSRKVDIVVEKLANMNIVAAALHGGMGSDKMDRAEVSKALREGFVGIVVATELAARGLDASLLTHVINLDLPTDASHYAHRAGRCGRGGRPGVVINITTSPQERNVPQRFADSLGIEMHNVEPRQGKLVMVEEGKD